MRKIAILDDSEEDTAALAECLERYFHNNGLALKTYAFRNPLEFIEDYVPNTYDLIFFDVDLPGLNGIEAARAVRKKDSLVKIVFVTNYPQFAIDGYGINALDYIVKPIVYDRMALKLDRILPSLEENEKILKISSRGEIIVVEVSSITYVEVIGHQLTIHSTNRPDVTYRGTLSSLEEKLAGFNFARCNACYLVNLRQITEVKGDLVYIGDTALKISHSKKKEFMTVFAALVNRGI